MPQTPRTINGKWSIAITILLKTNSNLIPFWKECGIVHCTFMSLYSVKTRMEGTSDIFLKNPYFSVTTEPNWMVC